MLQYIIDNLLLLNILYQIRNLTMAKNTLEFFCGFLYTFCVLLSKSRTSWCKAPFTYQMSVVNLLKNVLRLVGCSFFVMVISAKLALIAYSLCTYSYIIRYMSLNIFLKRLIIICPKCYILAAYRSFFESRLMVSRSCIFFSGVLLKSRFCRFI